MLWSQSITGVFVFHIRKNVEPEVPSYWDVRLTTGPPMLIVVHAAINTSSIILLISFIIYLLIFFVKVLLEMKLLAAFLLFLAGDMLRRKSGRGTK